MRDFFIVPSPLNEETNKLAGYACYGAVNGYENTYMPIRNTVVREHRWFWQVDRPNSSHAKDGACIERLLLTEV
jgi:hypothetical protein